MNLIHLPGGLLLAFGIYFALFSAVGLAWAALKLLDRAAAALQSLRRDEDS